MQLNRIVIVHQACLRGVAYTFLLCGILLNESNICLAQTKEETRAVDRKTEAEEYFKKQIAPFIKTYCIDCHQNRRPTEAGVNFSPALKNPGHAAFSQQWKKAAARVQAHDMPPEEYDQPTPDERLAFRKWADKVKFLSPRDPGPYIIRRLTKNEYGNTLRDLFGVNPNIADDLPPEVAGEGYLNSISPLQMEQYLGIAQNVLDQVLPKQKSKDSDQQKHLIGALPKDESDYRSSALRVANKLGRQVYRRPLTQTEIETLMAVYDLARRNQFDYLASIRLMIKAMLVSPQFLFITPATKPTTGNSIVPVDDYQLASRLSYLLWSTMPDPQLMQLAEEKKLRTPDVLVAQVKRMLMDPRSRALFDGFGAHWLGLGDLREREFDAKKFPQMTSDLRQAMYDEVRLMFECVIRENRDVNTLIDCDFTFLNKRLASIYGLEVTGRAMQKVQLSDGNRGGLLTMPAILATTSFPNRTSPVKRGVWVLERILGEHVPSAPPDVPELEKQTKDIAELTLRERTELHRTNAVCANCHKILDPIGFGLENFDAIGRWRNRDDNGKVIDASGELPGGNRFSTPKELRKIISQQKEKFSRNVVERFLAYALCRQLEGYDEVVVDQIMTKIKSDDFRMQTIVCEVVTSFPFTHRRIHPERKPK